MVCIRIKPFKSVLYALMVTSLVTACVKNSSEDAPPQQVKQMDLDDLTLTEAQTYGSEQIEFKHKALAPALHIKQIFTFYLEEISEFQIQRGSIENKECLTQDPFTSEFSLTDSKGNSHNLKRQGKKQLLQPGQYKLHVAIENGNLCKEVSMKFKIEILKREDLTLTENLDRGYRCFTIRENGKLQTNSLANVNTFPIVVKKITQFQRENALISPIIDNENMCEHKIPQNLTCETTMSPAVKSEGPIVAKSRHCIGKDPKERIRARAEFLVFKTDSAAKARINCEFKRRIIDLKMEDCRLMYHFGQRLPLQPKDTNVLVRAGRVQIEFNLIDDEDLHPLPHRLYINIMARDDFGNYNEVLNDYQTISKQDFLDGHIIIEEAGIRRKLKNYKPEDLKVVFFRSPGPLSGFYSLSLKETCDSNSESVIVMKNGRPENFCAQN